MEWLRKIVYGEYPILSPSPEERLKAIEDRISKMHEKVDEQISILNTNMNFTRNDITKAGKKQDKEVFNHSFTPLSLSLSLSLLSCLTFL